MPDNNQTIEYKQLLDNGEPFYPMVGKSSYSEWLGYEEVSGDPPTDNFVLGIANGGTGCASPENISDQVSITKTGGNASVNNVYAYRYGKIVHIQIQIITTAVTAAGSNVFEGTLNSHLPILNVLGTSFAGTTAQVWALGSNGSLTVRNLIGSLNGNGQLPTVGFAYIEA